MGQFSVGVNSRGIWKLSGLGWSTVLTPESALAIISAPKPPGAQAEPVPDPQAIIPETEDEKSQLYNILKGLHFTGFERLCSAIMAQTGVEPDVSQGKSCDGGVDGYGRMAFGPASLVKVTVAWQCKRYADGKVTSPQVRDFRGAIDGKAMFGMIFTTSDFTPEAVKEAQRPGSTRIELIGVEKLIEVLCENDMGVTKVMRPVYVVNDSYFEEYKHPTPSANQSQMELKP